MPDLSIFDPAFYSGPQGLLASGLMGPSFGEYATQLPQPPQGWLNSPRPEAPPNDSGGGTALTPSGPGYASSDMPNRGPQSAVPDSSLIGRLRSLMSGNPGQAFQGISDAAGNWIANNRNTLMALGAGMAGAQNLGQGLSRGMGAAIPAMQTDQRQQIMNQTAQALVRRGLPPDVAMMAATNPAALQQILPQIFGPKQLQFTQIGEDMMGNKQFGFVDPVGGKVYDARGNMVGGQSGGGIGNIPTSPTTGAPMQGQELLAYLEKSDPIAASGIKSILAGDINAGGRNLQKLLPLAALVEPGFTQQDYTTRLGTRKDFTSGKSATQINALNTVAGHLESLSDAADKLNNWSIPAINYGRNAVEGALGYAEPNNFNITKKAVVDELTRVWRGNGGSEGDIKTWSDTLNAAQSPTQLHQAIGQLGELIQSKINALGEQYRQGMGSASAPIQLTTPNTARVFEKLRARAAGEQPQPVGPATATPPVLGPQAAAAPPATAAPPAQAVPATAPQAPAQSAPVRVGSFEEALRLPKGTVFMTPDGRTKVR